MDIDNNKKTLIPVAVSHPRIFIFVGLMSGFLIWFVDAVIDSYIINPDEELIESLFFAEGTELWMRSLVVIVMSIVGYFASHSMKKSLLLNKLLYKYQNELEALVDSRTSELHKKTQELEKLASYDSLTNIYNRRKLIELAEIELSRFNRHNYIFSILMLDIDNFKTINDTYGHDVGDDVLVKLSKLIDKETRGTDHFARWGGEEFIILSPDSDLEGRKILAEKIVNLIRHYNFEIAGNITISLGIGSSKENDITIDEIIKRADQALYIAKHSGKDQFKIQD